MSANIYWRPVKNGTSLPIGTPSTFITALDLPKKLDRQCIPFLNGVLAGRPEWHETIKTILEAIERHDKIEVFYEY